MTNYIFPNTTYDVGRLSRYTLNPSVEHWDAISRLLRYLKGIFYFGLSYWGYPTILSGYYDANWISDTDEVKSTSEYMFTLVERVVSWKLFKLTCIVRFIIESKLVALEKGGSEAKWLRSLLVDLTLFTNSIASVCICCDCQAAIAHAKSKFIMGKVDRSD